jgi:hypothetical protein
MKCRILDSQAVFEYAYICVTVRHHQINGQLTRAIIIVSHFPIHSYTKQLDQGLDMTLRHFHHWSPRIARFKSIFFNIHDLSLCTLNVYLYDNLVTD